MKIFNHALLFAFIFLIIFVPRVSAVQILPGEQFEAMAREEIEKVLESRGEFRRHEINFIRPLTSINLPNGVIDLKIFLPTSTVSYTGVTPIKARISVGGKFYREINFGANVKVFDSVMVANHDLRIEIPVTESDFRIEEVAVDGRTEYTKDAAEIKGLVPHRFIRAGSPVSINYFQQPVVINNGNIVKIVVKLKGITASAKGIAMNRGRIGEIIKVRNEASQKILSARIVDAQTVEVGF